MAVPSSGAISIIDFNDELNKPYNAKFEIGSPLARELAKVPSGEISYRDFYGKSIFSYTRIPNVTNTYNVVGTNTRIYYHYKLGPSLVPRRCVWMGALFGGDYNSSIMTDAGSDGSGNYAPAPASFEKRIFHRSASYNEGYWHAIFEIVIPAGTEDVEFWVENTGGTASRLVDVGLYVMTGNFRGWAWGIKGYGDFQTVTVPANNPFDIGRISFLCSVGNWVSNVPITPYTERFLPQFMGFAMRYDSSPQPDTVFTAQSYGLAISHYTLYIE